MNEDLEELCDFLKNAGIPENRIQPLALSISQHKKFLRQLKDTMLNNDDLSKAVYWLKMILGERVESDEILEKIAKQALNDVRLDSILANTVLPKLTHTSLNSDSQSVTDSSKFEEPPNVELWEEFARNAINYKRGCQNKYNPSFRLQFNDRNVENEISIHTQIKRLFENLNEIIEEEIHPGISIVMVVVGPDLEIRINGKLVALIEVKTFWKLCFPHENSDLLACLESETAELIKMQRMRQSLPKTRKYETYWAIRQLYGNMSFTTKERSSIQYAILTTYNAFWFVNLRGQTMYISPAIRCDERESRHQPGYLRSISYFLSLLVAFENNPTDRTLAVAVQASSAPQMGASNTSVSSRSTETQELGRRRSTRIANMKKDNKGKGALRLMSLDQIVRSELRDVLGSGLTGFVRLYTGGYRHFGYTYHEIAMKFISVDKSKEFKKMALNEVAIYERLFDLQGNCIPRLLFYHDGYPFFVVGMTLVKGGKPISLDTPNLDSVLDKLKKTLDKLHARGVVHNDLKPSNVLVDDESKPWLIDFTHSKFLAESAGLEDEDCIDSLTMDLLEESQQNRNIIAQRK